MMIFKVCLLSIFLCFSNATQAKVYQWTDSKGQLHFSQTPPQVYTGKKTPKFEIKEQKFKTTSSIRKTKDGAYCGNTYLPQSKNPIIQLANAREKQKYWKKDIRRHQDRLSKFVDQQFEFDSNLRKSGDNSDLIKRTEKTIDDLKCALSWSKRETKKLETQRIAFLQDLEQTREEYQKLKNRCGEKPDIQGWTQDEHAKEWAKCEMNRTGIRQHNEKLRELKVLERKASTLKQEQ